MDRHGIMWRTVVITGFFSLSLLGFGARLYQLQVYQHDQLAQVAMAQRFHEVRLDPIRGDILDRQGRRLVTNRTAYRLQLLYPAYVKGKEPNRELLSQLANLLGLDQHQLEGRVLAKLRDRRFYEPLLVKDDLTPRELAVLMELRATLPGLYVDTHAVRQYPHADLAAHILGHMGRIESREEAEALGAGYLPGDALGRMGVEKQYDRVLRGTPGMRDLEVDASFRPTGTTYEKTPATPGVHLQLTIDMDLQRTLQDSLARTLQYVSTHPDWNGVYFPKANVGAAVVMDVRTGAVLAMASYPGFDPNTPTKGEFYNRALSGAYLPGSTWKMLSAAAALEYGVVDPKETVNCTGTYDKLEPKKDWKLDGHGKVDVVSALAHSCNIYFYEMGYRLGVDRMAAVAEEFGFGRPTGIDLPGEGEGWIPDAPRRQKDPDPGAWNGGKLLSAAIGQGPTTTPVQLARYTATIANGGLLVKPHVAHALVGSSGQVVQTLTPPPEGRVNLSPASLKALVEGMKAVTDWGTSAGAFKGLPFQVAGKTGTAEVQGSENCAGDTMCAYGVYVAFAPADRPEIAVAVVGERAGHGDSMNPVVRAALAHYFKAELPYNDLLYTMGILPRPATLTQPLAAPAPPIDP